jgi:SAM-dependent methyltransferase
MQKRHTDYKLYFQEQSITTRDFVLPYLASFMPLTSQTSVLEIGCGEGGNLVPFLELGCKVTGVDISSGRIDKAIEYLSLFSGDRLRLIKRDIYDCAELLDPSYDIIIMRDVIEHIHDQEKFMGFIKRFLGSRSLFFIAFPPWYNPFGGHQQICSNRILSIAPFYHILPRAIYRFILKAGGEDDQKIKDLLEIKQTGISIERFRKICSENGYLIKDETLYFINPNYKTKFGLKPRKQSGIISAIPHFRNYLTTCCYYILSNT